MPTLEVKCTVSDCFFHAIGDYCGAEKIQIDMKANKKDRTEFASDFDFNAVSKEAKSSKDTCCKTFISKEDKLHHSKSKK